MPSSHCFSTWVVLVLTLLSCRAFAGEMTDLAAVDTSGDQVTIRSVDGATIRATFLADDVVRIQASTGEVLTDEGSGGSPIVLPIDPAAVTVVADDLGTHRSFSTAMLELRIEPSPLLMELRRKSDDRVLWRELRPLRLADDATTQTLDSDPGERIYGGGQQNGTFEFNGRLMEISYSGGWEEGDRPSPAPFYMSDRGYGVLRNTWSDGVYDFRSDRYLTTTHAESRFDAYYLVGYSIHRVLDLYTRITGRARLLPRWAFGYGDADCYNDGDNTDKPGTVPEGWSDGASGATPDVVASVAAKYRQHDMPGSWILPNDGYGCGYADLPEVVARLGELGFRTGLWTENGVEKIAWEVGTAGTRVQKLDVAWTGKGGRWAMDANHDAAQGFLDSSDARPFIWTVMGWAGIQRYAVTWTGDQSGSWDYIRWHVPTLIGSGLSGMNYSTGDVDGIFGGSPETFTRDLQWKCFTPVLMGMSGWSKVARKHPWWFDEPYRSINRRYLNLRQRLMPYIYTLAHETELTGAPMVRGLMWDHPASRRGAAPRDPHVADHQFFLGRDLLVAPVYRSQEASGGWREGVYLPAGRWIDYWTGQVLDAGPEGLKVDVPVDLATLPVLVRAGAIIPMAPASLYDGQVATDPLTLDVYPAGESEFVLYEDDGETRAYRAGAYSQQRFSVSATRRGVDLVVGVVEGEFEGRLHERGLELALHTYQAPVRVTLNGVELPALADPSAFEASAQGWRFAEEEKLGVLHVKLGRLDTATPHEVSATLDPEGALTPTGAYPTRPAGDGTIGADQLLVVARPAEEPGHALENAFDDDPDTWFRTVRDQSVAYGPHELTLSLGGRRVVSGFRIAPRNDKHWKYGQVRGYEVYLADVNGAWGEPVATGSLEQTEAQQEVRFDPRAGRLLRFRVLSTHDDGADPMVLGATVGAGERPYEAAAPVRVGSTTMSSFRILEQPLPERPAVETALVSAAGLDSTPVIIGGLEFEHAVAIASGDRRDFRLAGHWQSFRAEVGLTEGTARFQIWGDDRPLWDSALITGPATVKPRLDVRGVRVLSLRTVSSDAGLEAHWAEMMLEGFEGDTVSAAQAR